MLTVLIAVLVTAPGPKTLDEIDPSRLNDAEMMLVTSLQGLTARRGPRIWLRMDGIQQGIREDLEREGTQFVQVQDPWTLLARHRRSVKGAVLYRLGTPSVNVATSLAGILDAVPIEESLAARAQAAGLPTLVDARQIGEQEAFDRYRSRFQKGLVIEQDIQKPAHLRDYAVKHRAFVMDPRDRGFRRQVIRDLARSGLVLGWGRDEFQFIEDLSREGATGVPADWCRNLSVLENLPNPIRKPNPALRATQPTGRYVAFVLSDGDNIQWLTNAFATDSAFYGSPLRGRFPMTWEVSPLLAKMAPRVLARIYAQATPNDDFVTGPGLPGYTFPSLLPNRADQARLTAPFLRQAQLRTLSFLNTNDSNLADLEPWLRLREVDAALYKEYAPYHRPNGRIVWLHRKPVVSYRFILWEDLLGTEDLARRIAEMPTVGEGRFALVNVHAWSYRRIGGPLEAVRQVIDRLPADTQVVTVSQLLHSLRQSGPK